MSAAGTAVQDATTVALKASLPLEDGQLEFTVNDCSVSSCHCAATVRNDHHTVTSSQRSTKRTGVTSIWHAEPRREELDVDAAELEHTISNAAPFVALHTVTSWAVTHAL